MLMSFKWLRCLFEKRKHPDGVQEVYVLGKKLFSYDNSKSLRLKAFIVNKGSGNAISIRQRGNRKLHVCIYGNDNKVTIDASNVFAARISIGTPDCPAYGCEVSIGEGTTSSNELFIILLENGSHVRIGRDCMFSSDVVMYGSDPHSIINEDGRLLNIGRSIEIGDHVWIGQSCRILKNTAIPDNSIIGIGSIVTSRFDVPNSIIAGSPAKLVKSGINWDRRRPQQYMDASH